jgi:hypothetical protein
MQTQPNIFSKNTTLPTTNIMNTGIKSTHENKIDQQNISWSEIRLKGALKPINKKITEALVKCVAAQPNLI